MPTSARNEIPAYYRDYLTKDDVSKILEASVPYETGHLFFRLLAKTVGGWAR